MTDEGKGTKQEDRARLFTGDDCGVQREEFFAGMRRLMGEIVSLLFAPNAFLDDKNLRRSRMRCEIRWCLVVVGCLFPLGSDDSEKDCDLFHLLISPTPKDFIFFSPATDQLCTDLELLTRASIRFCHGFVSYFFPEIVCLAMVWY